MEYYLNVFKNYANFHGRARRKEYWMFTLFNLIAILVLGVVPFIGVAFLGPIYVLAAICPSMALTVRRFHDIGKGPVWVLIYCVPLIGGIWFLILMCQDSQPGDNQYGANPKFGN